MKKLLFKLVLIVIVTLSLTGCYTIVWSPGSEFPTEDNSSTTVYYDDAYYGDYYFFYDSPWWWDITPPVSSTFLSGPRDENSNIETPRNSGERGTPGRVLDVQPPSRNATQSGTNSNGTSGNSGNTSSETRVNNTSSSSSDSGRESSSNSGNTVRNNEGGRSSGGRR